MTAKTNSTVVLTTLKNVGEGFRILTPAGLLAHIEWVDWVDEDGETVEATLSDDTTLTGAGATPLAAVWHEEADTVTEADLAAAPSISGLTRGGS